ncbi:MAG: bifunctional 4-hydroxy-2-oxoglutarate aldolase/2-dehydro-3-deoxy-phosphogluconate aldolase [Anaerolineae bacterium]
MSEERNAIRDIIEAGKLIAVVRASSPQQAVSIGQALAEAGVRLIEITFTVPNAPAAIRELNQAVPEILVGAGSVTTVAQAEQAIEAGARYVVSPVSALELIPVCHERGVATMVAGLTPTELFQGWQAGSDYVKLFPARAVGGPDYIREVLAPLPQLPLVPTGGVTLENFKAYLAAGARAVGLGSALVPKALVQAGDWAGLTAHARQFVRALEA